MSASRICLLCAAALLLGWTACVQTSSPGAAQTRPSSIRVLTPADHDLFVKAFDAAGRGDWTGAHALAAKGQDPLARQLLEWRYVLDRNSGATFAEIDAVMKDTRGWPLPGTLQARAEQAMSPAMAPAQVVAWFAGREPNSSIGNIRLGEALVAMGQTARGGRLIREGWAEGSFDSATELAIVQKDAAYLTPESNRARLDGLLWRDEFTAARRQISRVDSRSAKVALARIALDGGLVRARKALAKVRDSSDPGLLFDWARALRLHHQDAKAHAMLLRVSAAPLAKDYAASWWNECAIQAHDAMAAGDPRTALKLVEHAGLTAGEPYAEQQFLGGFIELRLLKKPAAALAWFKRLRAGVTRPISKARAYYWQGRAYEQMGNVPDAVVQYRLAAAYPETFYGQVALARVDPSPVLHLNRSAVETAPPVELDGDVLMPQIKTLADLGQAAPTLRFFVDRDADNNPSPGHIKRLMLSLWDWGYREIAVRLAKAESYEGISLPDVLYPVIPLPAYKGPGAGPEPALVLGLIRQETEFDPYAVSGAGARGLIQVMPATARAAARVAGLPWRPKDLASDTDYNVQLGMVEIMGHISRYDGSLVLAVASYNAGPSNAKKWITVNGDPRAPGADPIDWIETIPFGETRNYVQRVLENAGVYRTRLAEGDAPLRIMNDLYGPGMSPPPVLRAAVN